MDSCDSTFEVVFVDAAALMVAVTSCENVTATRQQADQLEVVDFYKEIKEEQPELEAD